VTAQNYDAELSGAAGGIVSVLTKSGGNALHGGAFFSGIQTGSTHGIHSHNFSRISSRSG